MTIKLCGMNDVGTRAEHLHELFDIWSFALGYLTTSSWHSPHEHAQAEELEIALELLEHHMQSEFDITPYAKTLNELKKPNDETST